MAVKDYTDPRWQRVRLRILERDSFLCKACGSYTKTLHVHHRRYEKKKKIWDAEDKDLITLCEECHERAEEIVVGFREIADIIVRHERIGSIAFRIDERIHDLIASKIALMLPEGFFSMGMRMIDSLTSEIISSSCDFMEGGGGK